MKPIKKAQTLERQKYIAKLKTNRLLSFINIVIISVGFILSYFEYNTLAKILLSIGIILAIYVIVSNIMARREFNKFN